MILTFLVIYGNMRPLGTHQRIKSALRTLKNPGPRLQVNHDFSTPKVNVELYNTLYKPTAADYDNPDNMDYYNTDKHYRKVAEKSWKVKSSEDEDDFRSAKKENLQAIELPFLTSTTTIEVISEDNGIKTTLDHLPKDKSAEFIVKSNTDENGLGLLTNEYDMLLKVSPTVFVHIGKYEFVYYTYENDLQVIHLGYDSLSSHLAIENIDTVQKQVAVTVALVSILKELNTLKIAHNNIGFENLKIGNSGLKIYNFENATRMKNKHMDQKQDIYAVGQMIQQMLFTNNPPIVESMDLKRIAESDDVDMQLYHLSMIMTNENPLQRPTMQTILNHKVFSMMK